MAQFPYSTTRWVKLRRLKLSHHTLCEACLARGRVEPATTVHHRHRVTAGGDPYPALDQLASLCAPCHNAHTRCEQTGRDFMRTGCDVFGRPLDPAHPWNKEK
jgi:5-methylcytosine-specific restriction enzyme A